MTYPLIGNYGMADDDYESDTPTIGALIVHEYNDEPSNFRSTGTLSQIMEKYRIPGISGIDTRKLTRSIRDVGGRRALITAASVSLSDGLEFIRSARVPSGNNVISLTSLDTVHVLLDVLDELTIGISTINN